MSDLLRMAELLDAAAVALDDKRSPFDTSWLTEHKVTFDEVMSLSEWMALGSELVAILLRNPRAAESAMAGAMLTVVSDRLKNLDFSRVGEST